MDVYAMCTNVRQRKRMKRRMSMCLVKKMQHGDVIDDKLLNKIEKICRQRWDAMINNEDEVGDAVHLQSKIMTSLFQIDDSFQIHKNTEKYKQISKFSMKGELDMTQIDKFEDAESEE